MTVNLCTLNGGVAEYWVAMTKITGVRDSVILKRADCIKLEDGLAVEGFKVKWEIASSEEGFIIVVW
jgi:hypothetical protein